MVDIEGQVVAAALLAGLDQNHAAGVGHALVAQGQKGRKRAEHRIAVIGAAPAIEPVALDYRLPRPQSLGPAVHLRLLVQMAIEQDRVVHLAWNLDQDHGRAAGQAHHLEAGPRQGGNPIARPGFQ
jgi:hypothetical protein